MANSSLSDEQNQLRRRARRRLLGAIILVTGLVVFLPMVLDDEPKPVSDDIAINIPSQDAKPQVQLSPKPAPAETKAPAQQANTSKLETPAEPVRPATEATVAKPVAADVVPAATVIPVVKPAKSEVQKTEASKPAPAEPTKVAEPPAESKPAEPAKPPAKIAEKPAAKPEPSKESKPAHPKPADPADQSGFVVRLGAFAKVENAKQLKAKLTAMGIRNYSDVLKTPSGDKFRVRAGPYPTRKEAENVRDKLKAVNMAGEVVAKP